MTVTSDSMSNNFMSDTSIAYYSYSNFLMFND